MPRDLVHAHWAPPVAPLEPAEEDAARVDVGARRPTRVPASVRVERLAAKMRGTVNLIPPVPGTVNAGTVNAQVQLTPQVRLTPA